MALFTTFYPTLQIPPSGPVSEGLNSDYYVYGPWDHYYRTFVPWVLATSKFTDTGPNTQTYTRPVPTQPVPAPYRQYLVRFVTPPLKAQTLGGTIDLVLGLRQSNVDMLYRYRIVVWVSKGSEMAYYARGLALDYSDPPGRMFPTVSTGWGLAAPQPLAPIAIEEGDHLIVEVGAVVDTAALPGSPSRNVTIAYASMTGPPPAGVPYPDLVVGSTATLTNAGHVLFSQPLDVADAPANDSCAAPIVIPSLPYDSGLINIERATYDPTTDLQSSCRNSSGEGLYNTTWWRWTATATGTLRLEGLSAGDTTLTVYTGSCGALTEISCRVGYNGSDPLNIVPVTLGTTYYFRLGARFQLDGAFHSLKARWVTPASNDHFADRIVIPSLPFTHAVDMTIATFEPGEPQNPDGWTYVDPVKGQSVWYEWTADAAPGNIRVNTMGSLTASMVTIWTGPWGAMTEVFSAPWTNTSEVDPETGLEYYDYFDQANCVFTPTPGVTYYISILTSAGAYWNNDGGDLTTVTISRAFPAPPNETCDTAVEVTSIPYYATHDFTNAADAMPPVPLGDCDWFTMEQNDSGKALWFKWTADRTARMNFNTFGGSQGGPYTEVIIYTGTCDGLVPLVCDGLNLDTWQTQIIFEAIQGTTYYWRIDSQGRIEGKFYFFLDVDYDTFFDGDVVVGCDWVYLFAASGAFRRVVGVGGGIPTASGTDPDTGLLYQALFVGNKILRLNARLEVLGEISTLPGITPEVPGFFSDGRLVVGHWGDRATWGIEELVDPTFAIRQFDPDTGALIAVHAGEQEFTGTAWVDPASDQRTIVYTSHGRRMLRFDVVADTQLPDFMLVPGEFPTYEARGLRQRPNGEYLLADRTEVKRLSADGSTVLQAYPIPSYGRKGWEGPELGPYLDDLNVIDQSPDATSFWIGDQDTTEVQQIDVATGAVLLRIPGGPFGQFGYHRGAGQLCGLSVIGGFRAGAPPPRPPQPRASACALDFPHD